MVRYPTVKPPGIIARWREGWRNARKLRAARRGVVPSPTSWYEIDSRDVAPYEELQAARASAENSIAIKLDPYQTRVPQYPVVDVRSMFRSGYQRNEVVRRCFDVIIEAATQARPELTGPDGQPVGGAMAREFASLMLAPYGDDSDLTGTDMWVRWWLDVLGTGNGMLEAVPGIGTAFPVRLARMDPWRTGIEPDADFRIRRYLYRLGGQWYEIPRERVIHYRQWGGIDEFWGVPRLYAALRSLATDSDLIDMMKVTFQNLGVPPVVLEYPLAQILEGVKAGAVTMRPDQDMLREVSDRWQEKYSGKNRGKAGVAWGWQVKVIGLNFRDLAIGELVATTERRILMAYGVNPLLVGQSGTEQQRGHNFTQAREFFYAQVIQGMLRQVAGVLSARLAQKFIRGSSILFKTDHIDIMREARLRRGKEAATIFQSGLLRRHACQRLVGEPEDGDDVFYPDVYGTKSTGIGGAVDTQEET